MADDVAGITPDRLRSFVERIENLEDEKRAVQEQIKEVLAEAKGEGYDVKILRKILQLRRKKPHERKEEEELLEVYMAALGMM